MVTERTFRIDGADVTIGRTTRPAGDILSIKAGPDGVRVRFRDGSEDVGGDIADLFTLRDICPWATVDLRGTDQ